MVTTNADPCGKTLLASPDVRNAVLNAEIDKNAPVVYVHPPSEVVKVGLVSSSTLWRCTKAYYGLKESPKMWEDHRDKTSHGPRVANRTTLSAEKHPRGLLPNLRTYALAAGTDNRQETLKERREGTPIWYANTSPLTTVARKDSPVKPNMP
eukprot:6117930-Amphidinium_carterae.3